MSYKIIGDSCLDLTEEMKRDSRFQMIPLTLQVDDTQVIDDETFNQKRFLELVKASPNCPKTACPSPVCHHSVQPFKRNLQQRGAGKRPL